MDSRAKNLAIIQNNFQKHPKSLPILTFFANSQTFMTIYEFYDVCEA